jgi:hypothetical protein
MECANATAKGCNVGIDLFTFALKQLPMVSACCCRAWVTTAGGSGCNAGLDWIPAVVQERGGPRVRADRPVPGKSSSEVGAADADAGGCPAQAERLGHASSAGISPNTGAHLTEARISLKRWNSASTPPQKPLSPRLTA